MPAGQSAGIHTETPGGDAQNAVPVQAGEAINKLDAGHLTTTDALTALRSRVTENQSLNTDESSLIIGELEQAFQALVEPFAANLQSYEPSVLLVFLSTWIAAAGITYEYLRRKAQLNALNLDTWVEWRSIPLRHDA
jgi:hypothetical protein